MSRQKGTPNKKNASGDVVKSEKEVIREEVHKLIESKYDNLDATIKTLKENAYIVCEGFTASELSIFVMKYKERGFSCVGGIAIHDIRNPVTNEYVPHYYQAIEKLEN